MFNLNGLHYKVRYEPYPKTPSKSILIIDETARKKWC